jgi:uncharacterized membrane protein HdeD (DUF308 family)
MTHHGTLPTTTPAGSFSEALRRLYFVRFAFALIWALVLIPNGDTTGALLTVLVVAYPLFDAGAVLWQLRARTGQDRSRTAEWINVAVSVAVAAALGVTSQSSLSATLAIWGAWAIASGVPQLVTAVRNRRDGGQVAQMLSGGISVLAGASFLAQGRQHADSISSVGGYAAAGAIFFLVSAIRLSVTARKVAA